MIDAAPLLKIAPIFTVALISPGPDFMMISSMALSRGRLAGFLAALGIAVGIVVYTALCLLGLGVVFLTTDWLVTAVRIFGGCYLIYLGYQLWRTSMTTKNGAEIKAPKVAKNKNPFLVGVLTNMTNPKAMVFNSSIFALTVKSDTSFSTEAAIVAMMSILALVWFSFVTFSLSTPAVRKVYMHWTKWIDRAAGTFLALFGLRLLWSGRN